MASLIQFNVFSLKIMIAKYVCLKHTHTQAAFLLTCIFYWNSWFPGSQTIWRTHFAAQAILFSSLLALIPKSFIPFCLSDVLPVCKIRTMVFCFNIWHEFISESHILLWSARFTWFLEKVVYSSVTYIVTYIVTFIEKILLFYCVVTTSGKSRLCGCLLLFVYVDWINCNKTKPFHSCLEVLTPCKLFQSSLDQRLFLK